MYRLLRSANRVDISSGEWPQTRGAPRPRHVQAGKCCSTVSVVLLYIILIGGVVVITLAPHTKSVEHGIVLVRLQAAP